MELGNGKWTCDHIRFSCADLTDEDIHELFEAFEPVSAFHEGFFTDEDTILQSELLPLMAAVGVHATEETLKCGHTPLIGFQGFCMAVDRTMKELGLTTRRKDHAHSSGVPGDSGSGAASSTAVCAAATSRDGVRGQLRVALAAAAGEHGGGCAEVAEVRGALHSRLCARLSGGGRR